MKKLLFLIGIIAFLGCDDNSDSDAKSNKYFNGDKLDALNLAKIDDFWNEGEKIDTSFYMGANFENHPAFIEGIRLSSGNGKAIWISVFKTKEDAVTAMEMRRNNVACIIEEGNPDEFENQWWYSDCGGYAIFVNQYNTIIEIDFSSNATFDLVKGILLDIAEDVNERIVKLSEAID